MNMKKTIIFHILFVFRQLSTKTVSFNWNIHVVLDFTLMYSIYIPHVSTKGGKKVEAITFLSTDLFYADTSHQLHSFVSNAGHFDTNLCSGIVLRQCYHYVSLLGETLFFFLSVTNICMFNSPYSLNGNSFELCMIAYYHKENQIFMRHFDCTIFKESFPFL